MNLDHVCHALIDVIIKAEELIDRGPEFCELASAVAAFRADPEARRLMRGNEFAALFAAVEAAVDACESPGRPKKISSGRYQVH
jgi:hypothetical protein